MSGLLLGIFLWIFVEDWIARTEEREETEEERWWRTMKEREEARKKMFPKE